MEKASPKLTGAEPEPAATDAPALSVQVLDAMQDGQSGLMTVRTRAIQTTRNMINPGPIRNYAIDPDTLNHLYGGDLDNWLAWIKADHQKYHGVFQDMKTKLQALKGRNL